MRSYLALLVMIILLTGTTVTAQQPSKSQAQRPAQSNVVSRYIEAVQHRDYKTIIDLTYAYQADVGSIKAQNPQVLWAKLIGDYYQNKTSNLSQDPGVWGNFLQGAMAGVGDPTQSIRGLQGLMSRPCNWSITERRQGQVRFPLGPVVPVTMSYVSVSYPTAVDAPIAPRRLKQVILNFNVATASGLVVSVERLAAGDVFWPIPALTNEMARDVAMSQLAGTALHFHVSLVPDPQAAAGGQPWFQIGVSSTGSDRYWKFLEQNGFRVRQLDESRTVYRGRIQLPESWTKYTLTGENRQAPLRRSYRVEESTEVEILDLQVRQQDGTARAKVRLVHHGCSAVCRLVQDLYKTPEFVTWDEPFRVWGNNGWGLFRGNGAEWPQWEEGSVDYRWDEVKLRWTIPVSDYISDATAGPPVAAPVSVSQATNAPATPATSPLGVPVSVSQNPEATNASDKPTTPKADSVVGHYVNQQSNDEYLDLESNAAFRWRVGGQDFTGSYQISEGVLTLRFPPVGATARGKLSGGRFNCCLSNGLDPTAARLIDDESKDWVTQAEPKSVSAPSPVSALTSFSVRHRHGNAIVGTPPCSGTLSVFPDGRVTYHCTGAENSTVPCHDVSFALGSLRRVKTGFDGALHLESETQGKWDFYGSPDDIKKAQAAIAPLVQK